MQNENYYKLLQQQSLWAGKTIVFGLLCSFLWNCAYNKGPRPFYDRQSGAYGFNSRQKKRISAQKKLADNPSARAMPKKCATNGCALVEKALSYSGVPYRWGGTTRSGMDCSGLINRVFIEVLDINLPHSSSALFSLGKPVSKKNLKPGDLVFFGSFMGIDHAGIYTEKGRFIHSSSKIGVSIAPLDGPYFGKRYKGARRLTK